MARVKEEQAQVHLTPKELAKRLRANVNTLANWRWQGVGPRFIKVGRKVLYPLAEIEAFEQRQLRSNTTQDAA